MSSSSAFVEFAPLIKLLEGARYKSNSIITNIIIISIEGGKGKGRAEGGREKLRYGPAF